MATTIVIAPDGFPNEFTGGFSSTASNSWTLDLTGFTGPVDVNIESVASNYTRNSGFDITSVTAPASFSVDFVHNDNSAVKKTGGSDDWQFSAIGLATGLYTINVTGIYKGLNADPTQYSGYIGKVTLTASAAPEPAAWSLMILGVGGMGAALRTRRRKAVAA